MRFLKRIMAATISTAILTGSSLSMNMVEASSSAGIGYHRIYFDVSSNSNVCLVDVDWHYNVSDCNLSRHYYGNLGGIFTFSYNYGATVEIYSTYHTKNYENLTAAGTIGVILMHVDVPVNDIFDVVEIDNISVMDEDFNPLPISRVKMSNTLVGDVNQDGFVNESDLTLLRQYYNGSASLSKAALRSADTNGDFSITYDDITCLSDYIYNYVNFTM